MNESSDKHADQRDKKRKKRKHGMRVHGKSVFTILEAIRKKGVKNGKSRSNSV